jgi:hypothetical protein
MITEPSTMLTDYALAGVTCWLAWRLCRRIESQASRIGWIVAFAALALTALAGGTYHGFRLPVWKATVFLAGIISFAMVAGSAIATTAGPLRAVLLVLAGVKLVVYGIWMLAHDDYVYVIADTGAALAVVAVLHGWALARHPDVASRWILAGVAVSLLAAGVQASGFDLHRQLNHNDLYHLIQIAAMALFYRGVRVMRDERRLTS